MMLASRRRVVPRDRDYRQPKHALPSAGRAPRRRIRSPKSGGRHIANPATSSYEVALRTSNMWATPRRVIRRLQLERTFDPVVAVGTAVATAARYLVGAGRRGALSIVFIVCAICASGVIAAPHIWPTGRSQTPVTGHSGHAFPKGEPIPSPPQQNSVRNARTVDRAHSVAAPPTSNAPRAVTPPLVSRVQSVPAASPQNDPAREVQDLPPAQADPGLEAALSDLDEQAELDESMRRQPPPSQQPPVVVNPGPSSVLPVGPQSYPPRPGP